MKKKIAIAGLIILAISSWSLMKYRASTQVVAPPVTWVQAAAVKESVLPLEVQAIGTLVARTVEITPELSGHVRHILFQDGVFVKKDTPLIQLDDALYQAKYMSANAQLGFTENDYKRKKLLGQSGVISRQAIEQAEADLKEKRALAEEQSVMVKKMKLVAPFDGMVGKSKVNPGDYVTTGQGIVTLTDTKRLRIEYNVPEAFFPYLKQGQEVQVTTSTYANKKFLGKVTYISPTINMDNRSVSLYAEILNNDNLLAPGMFVTVRHSLGKEEHAIVIPAKSLVPVLDGQQVYKIVNDKAYAVSVTVGKRQNDEIQIVQGLSVGDLIITDGQLKVKNGMPVKVKS